MKLKIIYQTNKVKTSLDRVLNKILKKIGFEKLGSGYNFKTKERDISYENKKLN